MAKKTLTAGELRSAKAEAKKDLKFHETLAKGVTKELMSSTKAAEATIAKAKKEHDKLVVGTAKGHEKAAKSLTKSIESAKKAAAKASEKLAALDAIEVVE